MIDANTFFSFVKAGKVPPIAPNCASHCGHDYSITSYEDSLIRDKCTKYGMWAIVDMHWTAQLAQWISGRRVLEVMAGIGWLAKALSIHDIDVLATDDFSWENQHSEISPIYPIKRMDAVKAAQESNADILICSWPPYGNDIICRVCEAWGPERDIVYIGESEGGCNAPDEFFKHFKEIENPPEIDLLAWNGLHDYIFFGKYIK